MPPHNGSAGAAVAGQRRRWSLLLYEIAASLRARAGLGRSTLSARATLPSIISASSGFAAAPHCDTECSGRAFDAAFGLRPLRRHHLSASQILPSPSANLRLGGPKLEHLPSCR